MEYKTTFGNSNTEIDRVICSNKLPLTVAEELKARLIEVIGVGFNVRSISGNYYTGQLIGFNEIYLEFLNIYGKRCFLKMQRLDSSSFEFFPLEEPDEDVIELDIA